MRFRVTLAAPVIVAALWAAAVYAQAPAPAEVSAPAPAAAPATAATPAGVETGKIAWYGKKFNGHKTASGQHYNPNAMTMAHKSLPFGTQVKVTNPANGHSVVLRVNDRGPSQADRVGDVSYAAAKHLGMVKSGVIDAQLEVVEAKTKP
jgi:rare lipoprotein A